jgi:hypothetical protein
MAEYFCNHYDKVNDSKYKTCQRPCRGYYCIKHSGLHPKDCQIVLALDYKKYCTLHIKSLLEESNVSRGKEAKAKVARKMFSFLSKNKIFVYCHKGFYKTVQDKFTEFESQAGWVKRILQLNKYKSKIFNCGLQAQSDDKYEGAKPDKIFVTI